jgi:hypothetical protein
VQFVFELIFTVCVPVPALFSSGNLVSIEMRGRLNHQCSILY